MNTQLHDRMDKALSKYTPHYLCEGNYTCCLLLTESKQIVSFGIAKRNPNCDPLLPERGREIALARATKKLMDKGKQKTTQRARC